MAQAYLNQKRLDAEAKQLHVGATNFAKQTQQWLQLIDGFSTALKVHLIIIQNVYEKPWAKIYLYYNFFSQELGDVENWAKSIECDMRTITDSLEIAYKTSRENP